MIIRELGDGTIIKILGFTDEEQFMFANPNGQFSLVDSLPPSASQKWKRVNGEIVSDKEADDLIASEMYKDARKAEYPDFFEYIDGIVKNDQAQIQSYIDKCLAVKAKYPKGLE